MPPSADLLALLNACRADPLSDLPRLVLADWLDEHDDSARAEFLRVQCELARPSLDTERIATLKLRERALIGENWRAWAGGLHEVCCDLIDAERRRVAEEDLEGSRPTVPAAITLRAGRRMDRDNPFDDTLSWKFSRGLIGLTNSHPIRALRAWANSDELSWLESLRMPLSGEFISLIDSAWVVPRKLVPYLSFEGTLHRPLTASEVDACAIQQAHFDGAHTGPELQQIIRCPRWRRVRHLAINGAGFDDMAFRSAVQQADYTRVTHLKLDSTDVAAVLTAKRFTKLVSLDVGGASLTPATLLALAKRTPRLNVLSAWRTPLGDRGFEALVASSWGETLHTLEVMNCFLGDDAVTSLVESGLLGRLYGPQLNLSMNRIADAGLATLAGSEDMLRFSELILRENRVGDAGVEALAGSPFAANLRYLDLWKNRLTDRAATALAASPHLGKLRDLNVRDNALTAAGRAVLTERYGPVAKVGF